MTGFVLGIDPGLSGAFVLLAPDAKIYIAMSVPVDGKYKGKLDIPLTAELFKAFAEYDPVCVLENVNGRPGQGAPAAFNFGHLCGALYTLAHVYRGEPVLVSPQKWKGALGVRGKTGSVKEGSNDGRDKAIVAVADTLFPGSEHLWRGPRGGLLVDMAEAALIALWGVKHGSNRKV
jgi:hypothetical protein